MHSALTLLLLYVVYQVVYRRTGVQTAQVVYTHANGFDDEYILYDSTNRTTCIDCTAVPGYDASP